MSYAAAIKAKEQSKWISDSWQIIGGSFFIALCAQIKIPLPFNPIPITGQTFAVLLVGCLLGHKKGFFSVLAYLLEIALGLPVRPGGAMDPFALIGPSAGYLLSMPVLAYTAGLARKYSKSSFQLLVWLSASCCVNLFFGSLWLAQFVGIGNAVSMGIVPFIPGEMIKCLAIIGFLQKSIEKA